MFGRANLHFFILDENIRHRGGPAGDDQGIESDPFELEREIT